jgi:hypothetical protein
MPVTSPSYFPPNRGDGTITGITAGIGNTSARSFFAGDSAGKNVKVGVDDMIVIGWRAMSAGTVAAPITDTDLAGAIIIGNSAAAALTTSAQFTGNARANIVIGLNAMDACVNAGANVIVGAGAFGSYVGLANNGAGAISTMTVVGVDAVGNLNGTVGNGSPPQSSIIIGYRAAFGATGADWFLQDSVIIGARACENTGGATGSGAQLQNNVVIGFLAAPSLGLSTSSGINSVIIGSNACPGVAAIRECVFIGDSAACGSGTTRGIVCMGQGAIISGTSCVAIGQAIIAVQSDRTILIGAGASANITFPQNDILNIGTGTTGGIYGEMANGNILVGNSSAGGAARAFGANATNVLKLLNGTIASANPTGGGYFYVTGANSDVHWVNSAGADTNLSAGGSFGGFANPSATLGLAAINGAATTAMRSDAAPALSQAIVPTWTGAHTFTPGTVHTGGITVGTAAQMLTSNTAFTNGAAAQVGTLLNAPAAGNPTKWIGVNDNGTLRYVPAW